MEVGIGRKEGVGRWKAECGDERRIRMEGAEAWDDR